MHGGKAEERMLDVVAGQNGDRALRRKVAIEQRRGDGADGGECRRVSQRAPCARAVALRKENALRGDSGPMGKPLR